MARHRLTHDLDEDPTVYDGYILGESLEFENGEAVLDDEQDARDLARRHVHVEYAGRVQEPDDAGDGADEEPEAEDADEEFDADEFVDRTPMDDVIDDIEAGEADDHLDAVADAAEREGVKDAIDERRE